MLIFKNLTFKKSLAEEKFFFSYIWILIAWSAFAFFFTFNNTFTSISKEDIQDIATISLVAVTIQFFFLVLFQIIASVTNKKYILRFFVAIFINLNFYSFYVVFIYGFVFLSTFEQIALFCTTIFIAYQFLASICEYKLWRLGIHTGSAALALALTIQFYQSHNHPHGLFYVDLPDNAKKIASSKIKKVDFTNKPNVYILSFDALLPPDVLKALLSVDPINYKKTMSQHRFRTLKNSFSDGTTTLQTFNRMLALHPEYYDALAEHDLEYSLFTGLLPAPFLEIFHDNGYSTSTYSIDRFFGFKIGPFTHHHSFSRDTLCFNQMPKLALNFSFFGYCQRKREQFMGEDSYNGATEQQNNILNTRRVRAYTNYLLLEMQRARKSGQPFLFFPYIRSPQHVVRDKSGTQTQLDQYRLDYSEKIEQQAPTIIDSLVSDIKKNDPNAIILLMGDHGLYITWTVLPTLGGFMTVDQSIKNLAIWERMAVVSAVYPPDVCSTYLSQESGDLMEKYAVHTMVLRQLIRCLSDGDDPINGAIEYRIYDSNNKDQESEYREYMYPKDQPGRYEDYLYEFPNRLTNIVIPVLSE